TPAGTFLASSEASGGDFIAVDGTGIYLSKIGGGGRVAHLTLAGGTVTQWEVPTPRGIAVKDGFVYVVASGSEIRKYTASGTLIKTWPISTTEIFPGGLDLAIDPAGNVYVVQNWGAIRKYSPGGELLTTGYTGLPGEIYGLGVNPWTGDVWVSADDANAMVELSSSLDKVLARVTTAGLSSPRGVGVGCPDAYVANNGKNEIVRIHPTSRAALRGDEAPARLVPAGRDRHIDEEGQGERHVPRPGPVQGTARDRNGRAEVQEQRARRAMHPRPDPLQLRQGRDHQAHRQAEGRRPAHPRRRDRDHALQAEGEGQAASARPRRARARELRPDARLPEGRFPRRIVPVLGHADADGRRRARAGCDRVAGWLVRGA
ncbi:MAG TPA: hypothetical protein VIM33_15195, partial [Gaiellaceae bacterium]